MPRVESVYSGRLNIQYKDIAEVENYKFLLGLKEKFGDKRKIVLPVFFLNGHFLYGDSHFDDKALDAFIRSAIRNPMPPEGVSPVDLEERFRQFQPLVVAFAGLIDGINPCAFTVIVFFISFLALQGYRKKQLFVIGISFISAVFATYCLIGLGLFGFFYRLEGFWLFSRMINFFIGIFSIVLGVLALYDFFVFKKTGQTQGLILQLPKSVKNQVHYVIGLFHRKDKRSSGPENKTFIILVSSAFITGFLVSLLEAVCTGQTYLPTISFILKNSRMKLEALGYLIFYNFLFVLPLIIIFLLSITGMTSVTFSRFLQKHLGLIKILMAVLFFGLGVFIIWRA